MKIDNVTKGMWAVYLLMVVIILTCSCNGCKKTLPPVENIPDAIEQQAKPVEDSLRNQVKQLELKNDSLLQLNQLLAAKKEIIRERKITSKEKVAAAEATKDSFAIVISLKEELTVAEALIEAADQQATVQGNIIINQEKIITNLQADVELQKSKFNQLKSAFNIQETQLNDTRAELTKNVKKLKRAKAWNKIFGIGTAAGVGLAAFIFL